MHAKLLVDDLGTPPTWRPYSWKKNQAARDHDLFDELWLAIYSPLGIHILKHPGGQVRFSITGLNQQVFGQQIIVYSSRNVLDVRQALDEMLKKMEEWDCQPLATILW